MCGYRYPNFFSSLYRDILRKTTVLEPFFTKSVNHAFFWYGLEKGNFILICVFKYGPTWKIWSSALNSQENTCTRVSFLITFRREACDFIKMGTPTQVLSCEFFQNLSKHLFDKTPVNGCFCQKATLSTHDQNREQV